MGWVFFIFISVIGLQANAGFDVKSCEALFSTVRPATKITTGAQFLHQKNQILYTSRPVVLIAQRTQNRSARQPDQRIENWLEYLKQISKKASDNPQLLTRLKNTYYKIHVIKHEEVPQAYYDLQVRLARERGHGNIEMNSAMKAQHSEVLIKDQQKSLDSWIEYLVSPDSSSYPMWAKFWAFQGMVKLSKFDKETQSFSNRSKGSTSPFVELNREAFAYVIDAVVKKLNKSSLEQITDSKFLSLLEGFNFGKLYARALVISKSGPNEKQLRITEGRWITYPKGSDATLLSRSLEGKNTGWCTAAESTASAQVARGDFHVYYSLDHTGKPTTPRVAIRMEDNNIAEVRGIGKEQNLDEYIAPLPILKNKLKEFGDEGKKYEKKSKNMELLTFIDNKHKKNIPLTKDEIEFLYEINDYVVGFGYGKDPRVEEIKLKRDERSDLAFLLDVKESEIALTTEEALSNSTRYVTSKVLFSLIFARDKKSEIVAGKAININAKNEHGTTLLVLASQFGLKGTVEKLLEHGADINLPTDNGINALMPAVSLGHTETAMMLIDKGINVHAKSDIGGNAFDSAAENGLKEIFLKLLEKGVDLETRNFEGETPLITTANKNHPELALILLDRGVNIHAADKRGINALMRAARTGNLKLITKLLELGAEINTIDESKNSALMHAIYTKNSAAALLLLKEGSQKEVDLSIINRKGETALTLAKQNRLDEVIQQLEKHGAK